MTIEEIALKYGLCKCDEVYTSRGLTAPDCPYHAFCVWEAMEEYGKQEAEEFSEWVILNATKQNAQEYICRFTNWRKPHTIGELYEMYQQQKQK